LFSYLLCSSNFIFHELIYLLKYYIIIDFVVILVVKSKAGSNELAVGQIAVNKV
jgi:hypothetical protein